ncbi:MAG TPA: chorismate synthase [Clostridiales bacterium]|nr:chorismate synthase [Clostridiales bacterium]
MSNTLGEKIKVTIFGQSHSEAIGVVIDGLPSGFRPDMEEVAAFMARRAPGLSELSTSRREEDKPQIISGLVDGATCGAPVCTVINNSDVRSGDYGKLKTVPRPSHADYTAMIKYSGYNDIRGGGQFSGRLTAPLCFAGALCLQLLAECGITVGAQILEIGGVGDLPLDPVRVSPEGLYAIRSKTFPVNDDTAGEKMREEILKAKQDMDSVGGIIRCYAIGLLPGLGEPMFHGLENRLASAVFGIPGVRGVSFGAGFAAARMRGSEHNDPFEINDGKVRTKTNNHGGILGGISSGMPVVMDVAIKPTASIGIPQNTVDLNTMENTVVTIGGRHDPCIVPRAVPCVEAAVAITLLDMLI